MKTALFAVLVFALAGSIAAEAAPRLTGGLSPVFGSNDYEGWNGHLAFGGDHLSISPEFRSYQFNGSNGRFNSATVRAGYDTRWFGMGVSGGRAFPKNGYSSYSGGADFAFTISPLGDKGIRRIGGSSRGGAPVGKGIARIDFGGGFKATSHKQDGVTADTKLTEQEFHGFVGASVLGILVSGRLAKYEYSTDLRTAAALPNTSWTPLVGHLNSANGFADTSFHANVEIPFFPMIRPFANYTYTTFEPLANGVTPGDAKAISAGVRVGLELVAVEAAFQHVNITGSAKEQNFYTLTAGLRL